MKIENKKVKQNDLIIQKIYIKQTFYKAKI